MFLQKQGNLPLLIAWDLYEEVAASSQPKLQSDFLLKKSQNSSHLSSETSKHLRVKYAREMTFYKPARLRKYQILSEWETQENCV